jgi:NADH dehydrogenase FAD-containing subunit
MSVGTKSVVVLGGGFAGTAVAQSLSTKLDPTRHTLTLISSRPFFIFYPATIRLIAHGQHDLDGKVLMPYNHLLSGIGSFKLGTANGIETNKNGGGVVVLEGGEKVKYDILVLAAGSSLEGPVSFPNTETAATEWIAQWRTKIAAAKKIVLVGAGAVGTGASLRSHSFV